MKKDEWTRFEIGLAAVAAYLSFVTFCLYVAFEFVGHHGTH